MNGESKTIRVRVFSAYGRASRPWFVTRVRMDRRKFAWARRQWRAKEFAQSDAWRDDGRTASWDEGFINMLHD